MVSWRCTSRITREPRRPSSSAILRLRMASRSCCCRTGWTAVKKKNSQKRSPIAICPSHGTKDSPSPPRIESEDAFVSVVGAVGSSRRRQQRPKCETGEKAADVRPPSDASTREWREQLDRSLQHLKQEPYPDED